MQIQSNGAILHNDMASLQTRPPSFIYCIQCGAKGPDSEDANFCMTCGRRFMNSPSVAQPDRGINSIPPSSSSRPNDSTCELSSASSSQRNTGPPTTDNSRSQQPRNRTATFQEFRARKEENRRSNFRPSSAIKKVKREEPQHATINIGMMKFDSAQNCLRPMWGKNLPLMVDKNSTCAAILAKEIAKRKAHDRHFAQQSDKEEFRLVLPDGSDALFLPGEKKEFFSLEAYKKDVGKPYKRITLFLCSASDKDLEEESTNCMTSNQVHQDDFNAETTNDQLHVEPVDIPEPEDKVFSLCKPVAGNQVKCPTCEGFYSSDVIEGHADLCAESENVRAFIEIMDDSDFEYTSEVEPKPEQITQSATGDAVKEEAISTKEIFKNLTCNLGPVSRINVRRGRLFEDYVDSRRKCPWHKPENSLKVSFVGEPAIDTGGPKREFLTEIMRQVHCRLFPDGLPVISPSAITENEFFYAGNLMAASLVQGGPAPAFLTSWVYEYIVSGDQGINAVTIEDTPPGQIKDFVKQLQACEVENDVQTLLGTDTSLDILQGICFRGNLLNANLSTRDKIVRSILMKEVVQDRIPILSQLVNGLNVCGVLGSIQAHPDQMRAHFCIANVSKDQLDNEKFNNLISVQFSNEQQKKALEINTYKYFSDFVDMLYHQGIDGYGLPDLLKFITGISEVPPLGFTKEIDVTFIHGCENACKCRPTTSTCDLSLKIPVHCSSYENVCELFLSALKEGFGFGIV